LGGLLVALLALPLIALLASAGPSAMSRGLGHASFVPALWLSVRTSAAALTLVVLLGTPLAWWLSRSRTALARVVEGIVDLPIVIPPAVVGVALLGAFGRRGLLGPALDGVGISLPFSSSAVVVAQVVVAAPFFVHAAAGAFRDVDDDLVVVARTLGASPARAFFRVVVPGALPGLLAGAVLALARSLGEFGATLLFAGNQVGTTQTLPLAIYSALDSDIGVAMALSVAMAALGALLLLVLRAGPVWLGRRLGSAPARGGRAR